MFYYLCKRCNHMTKQKIEMRRHLEKQKKCIIINNINNLSDNELYIISLQKLQIKCNENIDLPVNINMNENINFTKNIDLPVNIKKNMNKNKNIELPVNIKTNENIYSTDNTESIDNYCESCDKYFYNKSNLNKHVKKNVCNKKYNSQNINVQNNTNIINNNNNVVNINLNFPKGFNEEWDVSQIDYLKKVEILLSNSKFSKTLENILSNADNLNVILNDNNIGIVYNNLKNKYIPMTNKNIIELSMQKIYKHLKDFYFEINKNDMNGVNEDALKNELIILENKYTQFFKIEDAKNIVNNSFTHIYNEHKHDAQLKYVEIENNNKNDMSY